jgi:hypothetical protein
MHGCCRLEATGRKVEAGLQCERCGYMWNFKVKVSRGITQCPHRGLEPMPRTSEALMAQYLNVRQRK